VDSGKACTAVLCLLGAIGALFLGALAEAGALLFATICIFLAPDDRDEEVEGVRLYERLEGVRVETEPREYSDSYKTATRAGTRRPVRIAQQASVTPSGTASASRYVRKTPGASAVHDAQKVDVLRGGEFIGNRLRFKVKVVNASSYTITDITVYILSYPSRSLKRLGANDTRIPKIGPKGFVSPHFDFLPTEDCVRGEIVAGVSYIDMEGKPHTLSTEPYVIRAVCDLLQPEQISAEEFALKLKDLHSGELTVKVTDWTPEEMHEKSLRILDNSNFREVSSDLKITEGIAQATVKGWAKGKYTGRNLGVEILISGRSQEKGASCRITVSGEDEAMVLPAIDDLKDRLSAWLCPFCGSPLPIEKVEKLQSGVSVQCSFCEIGIGR